MPAKEARSGSRSFYDTPTGTGKTTTIPTVPRHFVKLVPNEQVVEVVEFETTDPAMRGDDDHDLARRRRRRPDIWRGTTVYLPACRPPTTRPAGGTSLAKLAALVEADRTRAPRNDVLYSTGETVAA